VILELLAAPERPERRKNPEHLAILGALALQEFLACRAFHLVRLSLVALINIHFMRIYTVNEN
jgi:hypothetical protein